MPVPEQEQWASKDREGVHAEQKVITCNTYLNKEEGSAEKERESLWMQ